MKDTIGNKFLLLNSVIRPLTEAETASYGHTGTHRLDIVFRLNGNTDFEFADVFNQGGEADMVARALYVVAKAIHEHDRSSR